MRRDDPLYIQAYNEWLGIIRQLWIACGKPVDDQRLKIYAKSLEEVPLGLLEVAVGNLLKEHNYANVPQIGEIWREINQELTRTKDYSIEAWNHRQLSGWNKMQSDEVEVSI